MKYDVEYLAGLDIAEKDGKVRLLQVPFAAVPDDLESRCNNILLSLQAQGYEVLNATPAFTAATSPAASGLWISYK